MVATVRISQAYPSHVSSPPTPPIVTDTIEGAKFNCRAISSGFKYHYFYNNFYYFPTSVVGSPIIYTWHYTHPKGYPDRWVHVCFQDSSDLRRHPIASRVPDFQPRANESVAVLAEDKFGNRSRDSVTITVHRHYEAERRPEKDNYPDPPVVARVSGPFPGGSTGTEVSYTETWSCEKQRGYSKTTSKHFHIGTDALPGLSASFGWNLAGTVSSSEALGITRGTTAKKFIPPGKVGIWYRRVIMRVCCADLYEVDDVGQRQYLGELPVTDWEFSCHCGIGDTEAEADEDGNKFGAP